MKIGCDPELFVKHRETIVSAHGMIPGTKEEPFAVTDGAVQVDGTAVEFNINPAEDCDGFTRNIRSVMYDLQDMLPEDHTLEIVSSVEYSRPYFDTIPLEARLLGCDPDFDAYTLIQRKLPDIAHTTRLRTAAGHIHFGWGEGFDPFEDEHWVKCVKATRSLEAECGDYFESLEYDLRRRELYGLPGTFRPKSYGVEWRTPSNQWIKHNTTIREVYDRTMKTMDNLEKGNWNYVEE